MSTIGKLLSSAVAIGLVIPSAFANEMRCGDGDVISGDQMHPLLKAQVLEKCGEPTERDGNRWLYQEQGKILVFDSGHELDHIDDASDGE